MQSSDDIRCPIDLIAEGFGDPSTLRAIREIRLGAGLIRVLISGSSSDGRLELFEVHVPPGQPGPELHTHQAAEECFTLIEGSAFFRVGDEERTLSGGQSLVVPRRVPHHWHVVGDVPLRMLITFAPAIQMEAYFAELADLVLTLKAWPPPIERMHELWSRYDTRPVK